ncbi:MAG: amino acid adenylation domain-containing protein, partial [Cyclobacteriaceae bacterium]
NLNGKVDRQSLPRPDQIVGSASFEPPQGVVEERLAELWRKVLGRKEISRNDSFFAIGGSSLKVIQLISWIYKEHEVQLVINDIFEHPELRSQALLIEQSGHAGYKPIAKADDQEFYALSPAQLQHWLLEQHENEVLPYNRVSLFTFKGRLDNGALDKAFETLVARHETLRTIFIQKGGTPYQRVLSLEESGFTIKREDLRGVESPEAEARQRAREVRLTPFRLDKEPMFKVGLYRLAEDEHVLMIATLHIIIDEWSVHLMARELGALYNAYLHGESNPLTALPVQYRDYTEWLLGRLKEKDGEEHRSYWLDRFSGPLPTLDLATDYKRPEVRSFRGAEYRSQVPAGQLVKLNALTKEHGATLFMGLYAVLTALLYRYTGKRDIVIGTPVAGRDHPDLENLIGLFLNVLALRTRFEEQESFTGLLSRIRQTTLEGFEHQMYPFDHLLNELDLDVGLDRSPLFDVTLILQNVDLDASGVSLDAEGLEIEMLSEDQFIAKGDLRFQFAESAEGLLMSIEYNTDIYAADRIERMCSHFVHLLDSVLAEPSVPLTSLAYRSEEELSDELYFNKVQQRLAQEPFPDLFAGAASAHRQRVAVSSQGEELDYQELDSRSNRLAHTLLSLTGSAEQVIGVFLPPGVNLVSSLLAILKSGKVYLPLSVDYGDERLLKIIEETGVTTMICDSDNSLFAEGLLGGSSVEHLVYLSGKSSDLLADLDLAGMELISIEESTMDVRRYDGSAYVATGLRLEDQPDSRPDISLSPESAAYIFYTSGSSGQPKGIRGTHGSLSHYIQWHASHMGMGTESRVGQLAAATFDASLKDILPCLISGATLVIVPEEARSNMDLLGDWIGQSALTHLQTVPSLFRLLTRGLAVSGRKPVSLEHVVLAGERLYGKDLLDWRAVQGTGAVLTNMYGLTETTILKTYYDTSNWAGAEGDIVPVGRSIPGALVAVINEGGICLNGEIGEVYIKSAYLTEGYLEEGLNESLFVQNPLTDEYDIVCRTGDLGRINSDGDLEILGRNDEQVKIHGVRVEPEEIRSALYSISGISSVELLIHQGDDLNSELLCYYVGERMESEDLMLKLKEKLPASHLPSHYIWLEEFPLNLNGKVDRQSLPRPDQIVGSASFEPPQGVVEERLAELWRKVLGRKEISRNDSFFAIGGSSLKVIQLISWIYKEHEVQLVINDIFEHPELRSQALLIEQSGHAGYKPIAKADEQDAYVLSHAQRRQWIIDQLNPDTTVYNMPHVVILDGELDIAQVYKAFKQLIARHEVLRTRFIVSNEEILQVIDSEPSFEIEEYKSDEDHVSSIVDEFIRPFDLSISPLLRVGIIELSADSHVFMVDMHHIVTDGISKGIMIREFAALYNKVALPEVKLQYKDYAVWQQSTEQQEEIKKQKEFWLNEFSDEIVQLQLPTSFDRPLEKSFSGDVISFELDEKKIKGLQELSEREGTTLFMVSLAIFNVLLAKLSNQEDIIVGVPTAGRKHTDLENILGMFINTICLRNYPSADLSFRQFLQVVKERSIACFENEIYPYEALVEDLEIERDTSRNPLFDVMFSYQNFQLQDLHMDGLEWRPLEGSNGTTKFDLSLVITEYEDSLLFDMEYSTELFEKVQVEKFIEHFKNIVDEIINTPEKLLSDIDIVSKAEKDFILNELCNPQTDLTNQDTLVSLFEKQAKATPDRIAFYYGESEITYEQIDTLSDKLAKYLHDNDVQSESLVPICLNAGFDMVIAISGILKAGAGYVPINPDYPETLVEHVLSDTNASLVICDERNSAKVSMLDHIKVLDIENIDLEKIDSSAHMKPKVDPENIAYTIYTSGTTGKPKGVLIEHKSIVNYLLNSKTNYLSEDKQSTGTYMHLSYAFDASLTGLFMPLLIGKPSVIAEDNTLDVFNDPTFLKHAPYDFIKLTPSHLTVLEAQFDKNVSQFPTKRLVVGGEQLFHRHLKFLPDGIEIVNEYGPTEATVGCTVFKYETSESTAQGQIAIGKPIDNTQVYILDSHQDLLPVGVQGELYIGGIGLAREYLNEPEITSNKFVKNPFRSSDRLYRTGDLARWLPDGNLEFLGRQDEQVKIRGHRVEIGQIEYATNEYPGIKNTIVIFDSRNDLERLVCYFTSDVEVSSHDLKVFLSTKIPSYMVPDFYQQLEEIPLTENGKINKKLLPIPELAITETFKAPENEVEEKMVEIWSDVLKISSEKISTVSNFFEIGGQSLLATLTVNKINKEFERQITLQMFFRMSTINQLSKFLTDVNLLVSDFEAESNEEEFDF